MRKIKTGEKLKKGTVLTHGSEPGVNAMVVTKTSDGNGYVDVKMTEGWAPGREFKTQAVTSFLIVRGPGKVTPKKLIAELSADIADRDATIAKMKAEFEASTNEIRSSSKSGISYRDEQISALRTDRDRYCKIAQDHEANAKRLSLSVKAMKAALKSASESLCHASNAVKA